MIAHVAAAGEDRGRVVLRLDPLSPVSAMALDAGLRVAQAFGSEMESLFVEDRQLFDLAAFPFVCETTASGTATRALSLADVDRDVRALGRSLHARVASAAQAAGVQLRMRTVRDEPMRALAEACAANGPWNVIALAAPVTARTMADVAALFDGVTDTTGIVLVGTAARRRPGPVVVAVEDAARLQPMLRAATRLAAAAGSDIRLVLIETDADRVAWMEAEARRGLAGGEARIAAVQLASEGTSARRMLLTSGASFVIAVFGGALVPVDGVTGGAVTGAGDTHQPPLVSVLDCPLLLVR